MDLFHCVNLVVLTRIDAKFRGVLQYVRVPYIRTYSIICVDSRQELLLLQNLSAVCKSWQLKWGSEYYAWRATPKAREQTKKWWASVSRWWTSLITRYQWATGALHHGAGYKKGDPLILLNINSYSEFSQITSIFSFYSFYSLCIVCALHVNMLRSVLFFERLSSTMLVIRWRTLFCLWAGQNTPLSALYCDFGPRHTSKCNAAAFSNRQTYHTGNQLNHMDI